MEARTESEGVSGAEGCEEGKAKVGQEVLRSFICLGAALFCQPTRVCRLTPVCARTFACVGAGDFNFTFNGNSKWGNK